MTTISRSTSEANIQAAILKYLNEKAGGWWTKFHVGPRYSRRGVPDIIGSYRGRFIGIEVKRPGGRLTKLQNKTHEEMRQRGRALVIVAESVDDVKNLIDTIDDRLYYTRRRGKVP